VVIDDLLPDAGTLLADAVDLRRRIHRAPELGLTLPGTQEKVLDALDGLPLSISTGTATTSVTAVLDGDRDGRTILLRGDTDALPMPEDTGLEYASTVDGTMHACGHDAHTAMLVGAARLLSSRRASFAGRVVFMFQPGEEGHHGARVMLDEGLLDGAGGVPVPEAAFAIHTTPNLRAGQVATRGGSIMASDDTFVVTVRGRGGHASEPHRALDPIPVACEIVLALQSAVTRRMDTFDPAVVTVARVRAGSTSNVIPETAELFGTMRTVSERARRRVCETVERVASGVAAAHGADVDFRLVNGYPVTVNDPDFASFVGSVAGDSFVALPNPVMGAEDFSYVLQRLPGAMAFLGTRPDGITGEPAPNHSNRMLLNEDAMASGIALHAAVALSFLADDAPVSASPG
jgi:hippurate hydrolase